MQYAYSTIHREDDDTLYLVGKDPPGGLLLEVGFYGQEVLLTLTDENGRSLVDLLQGMCFLALPCDAAIELLCHAPIPEETVLTVVVNLLLVVGSRQTEHLIVGRNDG